MTSKTIQSVGSFVAVCLITILTCNPVGGQSTASIPALGFSPDAKTMATRCQSNWAKCFSYIQAVTAADQENRLADIDLKDYGNTFAMVSQTVRDSQRLLDLREPCGVDYEYRGQRMQRQLKAIANKLKTTPNGSDYSAKAERYKDSSTKKRQKSLQNVIDLALKGELKKAEIKFDQTLADVDAYLVWLNPGSTKQVLDEVNAAASKFAPSLKKLRQTEAIETFSNSIQQSLPNIDSLLDITEKAIAEIGSTGNTTIDGNSIDGPGALKLLFVKWQAAHTNLNRCSTMFQIGGGDKLSVTPQLIIGCKLSASNWNDAENKLNDRMTAVLPMLIAADIKRATDDETARGIYLSYISSLGEIKHRALDSTLTACNKELFVLESRQGKLAVSIKLYKLATDDLLLWRKRAAASAARGTGATSLVSAAEKLKDASFIPSLQKGVDEYPADLVSSAQTLSIHADNVQAITPKAGYSVFSDNVWATVIGEFSVDEELNELRRDLFIGKGSPPLSMAAATSVLSAKRKHLISAGGTVSSVQIESAGVRFSKLPTNMGSFVPLNQVHSGEASLHQTLLRFNITPTWVQHEHFFKKL